MATTSNQAELLDRVWKEAFENGELGVIDEAMASDYALKDPGLIDNLSGPGAFKETVRLFRTAFPDFAVTIDDRIVGNDKVVDRFTITGTHDGDFMGIPATGQEVEISGTNINTFKDGKIVETYTTYDALGLVKQISDINLPTDLTTGSSLGL